MNPKVSIIIPVYNTEKYIEKCINSIYINNELNISDFEVIIINDGSKDNSQTIIEELMLNYKNIQLINKQNGGQSSARNIGFKLAKGDYIFCLDSDDYIDASHFKHLVDELYQNDLDMLSFNFIKINEKNEEVKPLKENYNKKSEIYTGAYFLKNYTILGAMCRYFYKRRILTENNIYLIEGIYHEDEEFVVQFLSYVNRFKYLDIIFYYYIFRSDSTINNKNTIHKIKLLEDIITIIDSIDRRINELDIYNKDKNDLIIGLTKKKEQLLISIFLRLIKEKHSLKVFNSIINILEYKKYYPLNIKYSNYKFKIFSYLLNLKYIKYLL